MEHRRSPRIPSQLQFDVYRQDRPLGRFRARDVSQEGVFLETWQPVNGYSGILELRFRAGNREHRIRGVVVRRVPGEGVGVQLAFWRAHDRVAYSAYLDITGCRGRISEQEVKP
jgi:hypothetical protein